MMPFSVDRSMWKVCRWMSPLIDLCPAADTFCDAGDCGCGMDTALGHALAHAWDV